MNHGNVSLAIKEEEWSVLVTEQETKDEVIKTISELFEVTEKPEKKICRKRVPKIGEYVLVNQRETAIFTRVHGGRHYNESEERYFGKVVELHPHVVVMESNGRIKTETVNDFKVGLIEFVCLKAIPEELWKMPYDRRTVRNFTKAFSDLVL